MARCAGLALCRRRARGKDRKNGATQAIVRLTLQQTSSAGLPGLFPAPSSTLSTLSTILCRPWSVKQHRDPRRRSSHAEALPLRAEPLMAPLNYVTVYETSRESGCQVAPNQGRREEAIWLLGFVGIWFSIVCWPSNRMSLWLKTMPGVVLASVDASAESSCCVGRNRGQFRAWHGGLTMQESVLAAEVPYSSRWLPLEGTSLLWRLVSCACFGGCCSAGISRPGVVV
jgi:hypothetical protein